MSKHVGAVTPEDTEAMHELVRRLVNERKRSNISQVDMAVALDVAQSTLSNFEHGKGVPTLSTLMRYARVLGGWIDLDLIVLRPYSIKIERAVRRGLAQGRR